MSGVVGRFHCTSTLGGTGLASLGWLRGGPGQAVVYMPYMCRAYFISGDVMYFLLLPYNLMKCKL